MSKCSCENCNLEVFENSDKCILHCEKDDWYSVDKKWNGKYLIFFWNELKEKTRNEISIVEKENPKLIKYNFEEINLIEMIFPYINYDDFNFFKELGIKKINFIKCKFKEKITYTYFENIEEVIFKETFFDKDVIYSNENILKEVEFINCKFYKNFNISSTIFNKTANFTQSKFNEVEFNSTIFKKEVFFNQTIFDNKLNLEKTFFYEKVNFHKIECKSIVNRETARIIKDSFEQQNNIIEANKFYALEMKKREEELEEDIKKGKNFFEWLVFKIHGISSNHSQDWILALFWILSFTFTFLTIEFINTHYLTHTVDYILIDTLVFLGFISGSYLIIEYEKINKFWYIGIYYIFYGFFSQDWLLKCFSNKLNPFSIMTGNEELTFSGLIYKIIIAYLIYQLIISIRQNTRRK